MSRVPIHFLLNMDNKLVIRNLFILNCRKKKKKKAKFEYDNSDIRFVIAPFTPLVYTPHHTNI